VKIVKITSFAQHCCGKNGLCRYTWQDIPVPDEKVYVFHDVETYTDNGNILLGNIPVADEQLGDPNAATAAAVVNEGNLDDLLQLLPSRLSGNPAPAHFKIPETVPFAAPPYTCAHQLPATFLPSSPFLAMFRYLPIWHGKRPPLPMRPMRPLRLMPLEPAK
jgi:hypothetical protein